MVYCRARFVKTRNAYQTIAIKRIVVEALVVLTAACSAALSLIGHTLRFAGRQWRKSRAWHTRQHLHLHPSIVRNQMKSGIFQRWAERVHIEQPPCEWSRSAPGEKAQEKCRYATRPMWLSRWRVLSIVSASSQYRRTHTADPGKSREKLSRLGWSAAHLWLWHSNDHVLHGCTVALFFRPRQESRKTRCGFCTATSHNVECGIGSVFLSHAEVGVHLPESVIGIGGVP